jgi:thioesterase domain-containing protein
VVGECSGGVLAHQLAHDLGRDGNRPDLVVLLDTPVPGVDADVDDGDGWSGLVSMARRRGTNAVALTRMQSQWAWYRMRNRPTPPALSHSLTVRNNARRIREATPPFYAGHVLYVQAVDDEGATETDGAPEYWRERAGSVTVVTAPGAHTGPESFLSRSNAHTTADLITHELAAVAEDAPQ